MSFESDSKLLDPGEGIELTQLECGAYDTQRFLRPLPPRLAYRGLCAALSFTYFPISNAVG